MSTNTQSRKDLEAAKFLRFFLSTEEASVSMQRTLLTRLGFTLHPVTTGGPASVYLGEGELVCCTKPPSAWSMFAPPASGWVDFFDQKGRKRFSLFSLHGDTVFVPNGRYTIDTEGSKGIARVVDNNTGSVVQLFTGEASTSEAYDDAAKWLGKQRPRYQDWDAYWDEEPLQAND